MKKKLMAFAASATILATQATTPLATQANDVHFTLNDAQFTVNSKSASAPKWFAANHTAYMPVYYVMQLLQNSLNVENHWDGGSHRWDLKVPANIPVNLDNIQSGTGNVGIYLNGTLVQRVNSITYVDPASGKPTTYLPVWYVMQLLKRIEITSTWDGGEWNVFTGIPQDELNAYMKAHPGEQIGFALATPFFADDKPSLIIENRPAANPYQPVTFSVVTPALQVKDFTTHADRPGIVQVVPTSTGSMVAAFAEAGAHQDEVIFIQSVNGSPSIVKDFSGDNGIGVWIQDGAPEVLVSNRAYDNNVQAPDGSMDDWADNVIYRFENGSFQQVTEYKSGVFQYEPQFSTDPQGDTVGLLKYMLNAEGTGTSVSNEIKGWKSGLYSNTFLDDLAHADISFLKWASPTQSPVLTTVSKTDTQAVYRTSVGTHTLYFTLQHSTSWQFTHVSVDVNPAQ